MHNFLVVAFVGWMMLIAAKPLQAQAPREILLKAIEAHGGADNLKKYPAGRFTSRGILYIQGRELAVSGESLYMLPDMFKNNIQAVSPGQKANLVQVFNAGKMRITLDDDELPLSELFKAEMKEASQLQGMQQLLSLLDENLFELARLEKADKVSGREVVGLIAKGKAGKEVRMFFDAKTHLLLKMERQGLDGMELETRQEFVFKAHKKYDGIMRPTKTEVYHDGKKYLETEIITYKHLESAEKKAFDLAP